MAFFLRHISIVRAGMLALACVSLAALAGCATFTSMFSDDPPGGGADPQNPRTSQVAYRTPEQVAAPLSPDERAVVAAARSLMGRGPESAVKVNGRTFVLDCIGTVSAIFWEMDIDVRKDFRLYNGDGVSRLYQSLQAQKSIHTDLYPRPGDVIFWDNTWDAKGDGKLNDDPLTHAGIVLSVDADGTIHYVHEHVIKGVTVESMNLLHPRDYYDPQGRIINNAMAMNSGISRKDNPPHWTSGDLWDSFGDVLRVRRHFEVADAAPGAGPSEDVLLAMKPPENW
jgi:hypothetical protein